MHSGRTRAPLAGAAVAVTVMLAACEHSTPFESQDHGPSGPFAAGQPTRLTYGGTARTPSWTPDGEAILFAFVDDGRDDHDTCIGSMPRGGGSVTRTICHSGALTADSLDRLEFPSLSSEGELAFVRASRIIGSLVDRERLLAVAPWDGAAPARRVQGIPFAFDGEQRTSIASVQWLDDARLAFVANGEAIVVPCEDCEPIVVESGREILIAEAAAAAGLTVVPTPGNATSVSGTPGDLYYTLAGDTRLYRAAAGGTASVVHDFGALGVVRDVHAGGDRLVMVVGGLVPVYETDAGTVQQDEGGELWVMDLPGGTPTLIRSLTHFFRRPVLSPDGEVIAALAVPFDIEPIYEGTTPIGIDTIVTGPPDLWSIGE
jgi:hypothetical protein